MDAAGALRLVPIQVRSLLEKHSAIVPRVRYASLARQAPPHSEVQWGAERWSVRPSSIGPVARVPQAHHGKVQEQEDKSDCETFDKAKAPEWA